MGYHFGTLENPESEDLAMFHKLCVEPTKFFNWIELGSHYINFNWLLYVPFRKNIEILTGARYLRNLSRRVIEEKKRKMISGKLEEHEKRDIVSVALANEDVIDPSLMVDVVMTLIQGGQESTAATFQWAMFELGQNPHTATAPSRDPLPPHPVPQVGHGGQHRRPALPQRRVQRGAALLPLHAHYAQAGRP
jgi:hypothetical protein